MLSHRVQREREGTVQGATGRLGAHSPYADWLVMAPAFQLYLADTENQIQWGAVGNSFATPLMAGLVAYWRGLPNIANGWGEELKKPANVKKLLRYMQRVIEDQDLAEYLDQTQVFFDNGEYNFPAERRNLHKVPFIWSGTHTGENCLTNPEVHPSCPRGRIDDLQPFGAECLQPGTPDLAERQLVRRAGGVCVVRPGTGSGNNGRGPDAIGEPITFSPGPASPTCVPGSPGCGTLCTGYYCVPSPTGFPPDRWDPEDPAHRPTTTPPPTPTQSLPPLTSCASYITTTVCNGSGGQVACVTSSACASLPPLPDRDAPYSGPGCATYTSTTICNGSGGQAACITDAICLPTRAPCPAWPTVGKPLCPTDYLTCLRTSQATLCAFKRTAAPELAMVEARVTAPPTQATPTVAPAHQSTASGRFWRRVPQQQQKKKEEQQQQQQQQPRALEPVQEARRDMAPVIAEAAAAAAAVPPGVSINNNTGAVARSHLLGERQETPWGCGGHDTGGCTVYNTCAKGFYARPETVSCVWAYIHITMHPIDTEVSLKIYEDGTLTCTRSIKCLTIDSPRCLPELAAPGGEFDCGGGNKITVWGNGLSVVEYASSKTGGRRYRMYLGQDGGDQYYPCMVTTRLWALCIDSDWAGSDGLCRTSAAALRARPRRLELGGPANGTSPAV